MRSMPNAPANIAECATILQSKYGPRELVEVFADEELGEVVGIMLEYNLEDVGDAENGPSLSVTPTRYAYVGYADSDVGRRGWVLHVYDDRDEVEQSEPYFSQTPKAIVAFERYMGKDVSGQVIAQCVMDLFDALGVEVGVTS